MDRGRAMLAGIAVFVMCAVWSSAQDTTLTLLAPVGGEIFYTTRDTTVTIRWSGVADTVAVRLDYTTDNGLRWRTIADSARGGSYVWSIKNIGVSSLYRVRVSQLRPPGSEDNIIYSGHGSPVNDAWWSPTNDSVVSVAGDAAIWDPRRSGSVPLVALPLARATYTSVRWSKDGLRIVTASDGNLVQVVSTASNSVTSSLPHPDVVSKVEIDSSASWIFSHCDDNRVRVFNLPGTVARATHNAGSTLDDIAINAQATRVLLCANEARVYGRSPGLPVTFTGHTSGAISGAFSPDGSLVCTVGGDAVIRLWDAATAVERWNRSDPNEGVRSVCFSPDGTLVAVGMSDSTITVWDVAGGTRVATFAGYQGAVREVSFSPDGTLLAGASDDNFARIHDMATQRTIRACQHGDDVNRVRWSAASDRLLTTSQDGTARVWQVREIIVQSDTSGQFSVAPPPPAFARFVAGGDTLDIREVTTIPVRLEGAMFLDLADIDSVRLRCQYDPSILTYLSSSVGTTNIIEDVVVDSAGRRKSRESFDVTVPLPTADGELFTVTFQATLGQDSITALSITRVEQIGSGPGMRTETRSDTILVRGICRESGSPRLYTSLGSPLAVWTSSDGIGDAYVHATLSDAGPARITVYDLRGRAVWQHHATPEEIVARAIHRPLPDEARTSVSLVVLTSETSVARTMFVGGAR